MDYLSETNIALMRKFDEDSYWWHIARNLWLEDAVLEARKRVDALKVVDIGCGMGGVLRYILRKHPVAAVMGFDGDERLLQVAREKAVPVQRMDFETEFQFPFRPNLCLCFDMLEHVKDDARLTGLIRKACDAGTVLAITVPALPFLYSDFDRESGHYTRYTKTSLGKTLDPRQWRILRMDYFFSFLVPIAFVRRILFHERPEVPEVAPWVNRLLIRTGAWEHRFRNMPFGTSLLCLAVAV